MRKYFWVFILVLFTIFLNIDKIYADCYQYCDKSGCETSEDMFNCFKVHRKSDNTDTYIVMKEGSSPDAGSNVSSQYQDYSYETKSMDVCLKEIKNNSYGVVDDIKCDSSYKKGNYVYCGNIGKIPKKIPELISWFITIVEIIVPIILVIMGAIDFLKAITSQKEDEIKKGQQIFIKRLITGLLIFFIIAIVKLLIGVVSSGANESKNIVDCIECFLNNKC